MCFVILDDMLCFMLSRVMCYVLCYLGGFDMWYAIQSEELCGMLSRVKCYVMLSRVRWYVLFYPG